MRVENNTIADVHLHEIKRFLKVITAIVFLFVGGLIYVVFRSDSLLMFKWFCEIGLDNVVMKLREGHGQMNIWEWVRYNMPSGLWLFSYMFIIDSIWDKGNNATYRFFITILPAVAIVSEVMQFFHVLLGTFDVLDMISYFLAIFLFLTIKLSNK